MKPRANSKRTYFLAHCWERLGSSMSLGPRLIHKALIVVRFLCIFLPSYIHPDEHFQSVEITASHIFNFKAFIPWEYQPDFPCRSTVVPFVVTGFPLYLLQALSNLAPGLGLVNARTLLYLPRFSVFIFSLIIDYSFVSICKRYQVKPYPVVLYLASSWAIVVFHTRPFSNTMESVLLAATLFVALRRNPEISLGRAMVLGVLFATGIFTRFTFVFFAFPICLYLLYQNDISVSHHNTITRVVKAILLVLRIFLGFLAACVVFVICDSIFFGKLTQVSLFPFELKGGFVVTPWNNFIYNLDSENLKIHGIHPRFTHFVVNFPLLVGPIAIFAIYEVMSFLIVNRESKPQRRKGDLPFVEKLVLGGCALSGLLLLSLAPHQEARFLLPMVFPVIFALRGTLQHRGWNFIGAWLAFNLILGIFFGVYHQGGVMKSLAYVQNNIAVDIKNGETSVDIIYRHTYMPPRTFLTIPNDSSIMRVHDIGDADLLTYLRYNVTDGYPSAYKKVYVICPENLEALADQLDYSCENLYVEKFLSPHFSTEFPPSTFDTGYGAVGIALGLRVHRYRNSCSELYIDANDRMFADDFPVSDFEVNTAEYN